jgi:hypothetical protein
MAAKSSPNPANASARSEQHEREAMPSRETDERDRRERGRHTDDDQADVDQAAADAVALVAASFARELAGR